MPPPGIVVIERIIQRRVCLSSCPANPHLAPAVPVILCKVAIFLNVLIAPLNRAVDDNSL